MDIINIRRSIRSFNDKKVEAEKIEKLLRAGMQAPSAGNQQPWEFVVVQDETTKDKLAEISPYANPIKLAPLAIVMVANKETAKYKGNVDQDMGACAQNILLETVNQGMGGVWIGVAPDADRMQMVSEILSIPNNLEVFGILAIGYTDIEQKYVDRYDTTKIHYEKFNG